eukprot:CAMPEP_0201573516 /NCGR_PEP_ID=MMETSP0190_2-20130828/17416_1 /ASSEMBLY_ACC=CAM_ASM_000263 /TAXON_ID=37353 /ORGANISM="Rosalina sp." /LENGTH=199 /DNA_ID=CAMNT_0048000577 /DNA_START=22 /DNA_END=621 /DNA_ORIENTATION=+
MGAKVIGGAICGILGLIMCICGVALNEITRVSGDGTIISGALWCGWDSAGACISAGSDCADAIIISQEDGSTYSDDSGWADACDACETLGQDDCAACKNKLGGLMWLGGMIGACVLGLLGIIMLVIRSTRGCASWMFILGCVAGGVALIAFLVITNVSGGCMDRDNAEWTPAVSSYAAIIGVVFYLIGGLASCGAGKYD